MLIDRRQASHRQLPRFHRQKGRVSHGVELTTCGGSATAFVPEPRIPIWGEAYTGLNNYSGQFLESGRVAPCHRETKDGCLHGDGKDEEACFNDCFHSCRMLSTVTSRPIWGQVVEFHDHKIREALAAL
jgi:hypothetical protein